MLCESLNYSYLNVQEDFVDNFKLYKKDGVNLNYKSLEVFARRMDYRLNLTGKLECRRGVSLIMIMGKKYLG